MVTICIISIKWYKVNMRPRIHFHIITLFPDSIRAYLDTSILGRAQKEDLIRISYYNPRDYSVDKWKRVDKRPYGGGPGMVLEAESLLKAAADAVGKKKSVEKIFFTPAGGVFDSAMAKGLTKKKDILFICGRYEGVDTRVQKILKAKKVSTGPYILTGGELPAATMIDAIARYIPGVLGDMNSLEDMRKTTHKAKGEQEEVIAGSEFYTKPEVLAWKGKKYRVPKVLLSGNHKKIEAWRKARLGR